MNKKSLTMREMKEALDAGKTLVAEGEGKAYLDLDDEIHGPYVFEVNGYKMRLNDDWHKTHWFIQEEPTKRTMTRMEALKFCAKNCNKILIRKHQCAWYNVGMFNLDELDIYEYVYINDSNETPHKFEVEV